MTFFSKLNSIMRQDFGSRGLMKALPEADLDLVSRELAQARRVLILTGFPVICPDQTVTGETDGPLGTADLAFALEANGCQVMAVTDCHSSAILKAALSVRCREARIAVIPETGAESFAEDLLDAFSPTHVVTLERPGKACDGHYHNMRGIVIDSMTADADCFLSLAREKNICTISIGDGGNEMGMGAFRKEIESFVPLGSEICSQQGADYALASGVSNWWGIGAAALLSRETQKFLLPDEEQETEMLRRVLQAGGADGATGLREMTVDRLSLAVHLEILKEVSSLVLEELKLGAA